MISDKDNSVGEKSFLSGTWLIQYLYEINEPQPLLHIIYKNSFEMDHKPKRKN